jgi:ribosomal protein L11 methyltransferase
MPTWFECSTLAEAEAVDAVAEIFGRLGQGVAIEEPVLSSADGEQFRIDTGRPVLVKTYLPLDELTKERRRHLEEAVWHLGRIRTVEPLRVKALRESQWADAWKKHFFVRRVGERLVIVPSWRRYRPRTGDVCIQLDPGMAFGTGLHPTTALCLRAIEQRIRGSEEVLDLGTGSGILAIAAAKLGARRVLALDVDSVAVRVAAENVALNRVGDIVAVRQGTLPLPVGSSAAGDPTRHPTWNVARGVVPCLDAAANPPSGGRPSFDLIAANISLGALRRLQEPVRHALRPGGLAVLSGILESDSQTLLDDLDLAGWQLIDQWNEAEWSLLVVAPPA